MKSSSHTCSDKYTIIVGPGGGGRSGGGDNGGGGRGGSSQDNKRRKESIGDNSDSKKHQGSGVQKVEGH